MRCTCRHFRASARRDRDLASALLRDARVVTDPEKLAQLYAKAARQKRHAEAKRKEL
jgi:hypothetical protein